MPFKILSEHKKNAGIFNITTGYIRTHSPVWNSAKQSNPAHAGRFNAPGFSLKTANN